jgi:hypothetical protein
MTAVSRSAAHTLSKPNEPSVRLLEGLGVEGDAHVGRTVKHRSRMARDPGQPNLRQVHLIHAELHDPCAQLDGIQPGLMAATLDRDGHGRLIRKAGIMSVVLTGGDVRPGDPIHVELPPEPHRALDRV